MQHVDNCPVLCRMERTEPPIRLHCIKLLELGIAARSYRVATTSSKLGPALQLCLTPLASNITESHIALNLLEFHGSCGLSICSSALKEVQGKSEHTGLEQDF